MVEKNIFGHIPAIGGVLPQAEGVTDISQEHLKGNAGHIRGREGPQCQFHENPGIPGEPVQFPLGDLASFPQIRSYHFPARSGVAAQMVT